LSLPESKSILAAMQTQLVHAQTDGYCDHRLKCSHYGLAHAPIDVSMRGLDKARGEWSLVTMAWNVKRVFTLAPT